MKDEQLAAISPAQGAGSSPSESAQQRYPLSEFPCRYCEAWGLPHLVDNSSEFYWHHVHPRSGARAGCARFGYTDCCGSDPRDGTATPVRYIGYRRESLERRANE